VSDVVERSVASVARALQDALGDTTPRQANEIIAALVDVPRYWPVMNATAQLDDATCDAAFEAVHQLQLGAPFAYAVARGTFRHLTLRVDKRVLIPRPETELLIDEVLRVTDGGRGVAIDIGTGSGAIALALASEGQFDRVIGVDVSPDALEVARGNAELVAKELHAPVEFRLGSLLEPVRDVQASLIVSNPPYIAYDEESDLPASVRDWEPALALFSADDGMALTTTIVRDAAPQLIAGGVLALEVDTRRAERVADAVTADGRYDGVTIQTDFTGRDRFVVARRRKDA